jgi:carboxyl-terminal processing protease
MVSSLDDNHVRWENAPAPPTSSPADQYGLGLQTSPSRNLLTAAPAEALAPLFVTSIQGGPASRDHVRPGDVILSVDGAPPFASGLLSQGAIDLLFESYPQDETVRITFHRPATGRTWTVTMKPTTYQPSAASSHFVTARLLDGSVADVKVSAFAPGVADAVLQAISRFGASRLRGVILDLRGDTGGLPPEVSALLGAFIHDKAYSYDCAVRGNCTANYVDNTTPLLHLALVVLTDRNCVSACEAFSAAVRDLHLGTLVGTRTGGIVAGPATPYVLNDSSVLTLPARHELAADHELINGIGVAPDYYLPRTAQDLSTGLDPDLAKALNLLSP